MPNGIITRVNIRNSEARALLPRVGEDIGCPFQSGEKAVEDRDNYPQKITSSIRIAIFSAQPCTQTFPSSGGARTTLGALGKKFVSPSAIVSFLIELLEPLVLSWATRECDGRDEPTFRSFIR